MYTALLMVCLSLAQGQASDEVPSDVVFYKERSLRIPLNVSAGLKTDIKQMILYVSTDRGASWQEWARAPGEKDAFVFTAPSDGQYWLQVAAINFALKQEPRDVKRTPPDQIQKMIIDTLKPYLRITDVKRHHDALIVSWKIQEQYPDWTTLKLEYQTQPSGPWTTVPVEPRFIGKTRIKADAPGAVSLRLHLRDRAGNQAYTTYEVPADPSQNDVARSGPSLPSLVVRTSGQQDPPLPTPPTPVANDRPPMPLTPPAPLTPPMPLSPPPALEPPPERNKLSAAPSYAYPRPTLARRETLSNPPGTEETRIVGSSETYRTPPPAVHQQRPLPALKYVNTREVTITYSLAKVGPSGVGSVDLWRTRNDGQTWELYAKDADPSGEGKHQRSIELTEGDGIYGFILVVKSRAGLGRREPKPGDVPEIRVELDTLAPVARLIAPVPDPQHLNALILSWQAEDKNLTERPITLEWAERREGPWQPIAANLENTGRYSWQLPNQLPVQVYLKVSVRDAADNVGFAITDEPQLVDLSEPEGHLLTVAPKR